MKLFWISKKTTFLRVYWNWLKTNVSLISKKRLMWIGATYCCCWDVQWWCCLMMLTCLLWCLNASQRIYGDTFVSPSGFRQTLENLEEQYILKHFRKSLINTQLEENSGKVCLLNCVFGAYIIKFSALASIIRKNWLA